MWGRAKTPSRRRGAGRRWFWAERVFSGRNADGRRTRWRWISSWRSLARPRSSVRPPALSLDAYSFPCRRTNDASALHPGRPRRRLRLSFLPSFLLRLPLQRPNLRASERDSQPFIPLRVNSLNRARQTQGERKTEREGARCAKNSSVGWGGGERRNEDSTGQ